MAANAMTLACPVRMGGTFGGAVRVLTARPSRVPVSAARGASRRPWTVAVAPGPRRSGDSRSSGAHRGASRARDVVVGAVADPRGTGVEDDANVGTPAKAAPANGRGRGARGRGARGRGGSRVPSPLRNFASLSPEDVGRPPPSSTRSTPRCAAATSRDASPRSVPTTSRPARATRTTTRDGGSARREAATTTGGAQRRRRAGIVATAGR